MPHRVTLRARGNQHYIYSGRSLLVTNLDGWVSGQGTEGFYYENTRLLSRDEVRIDGQPLRPASASPVGGSGFLSFYELPETDTVPARTLYLTCRRRLADGMRVEFELAHYGRAGRAAFELQWQLAADFADSDEAERGQRQQCAPVACDWRPEVGQLILRSTDARLDRGAAVRLAEGPVSLDWNEGALRARVELAARQSVRLVLCVEPLFAAQLRPATTRTFPAPTDGLAQITRKISDSATKLQCGNATVQRAWDTAVADLASLALGLPEGPATPAAGFPLYQQFFGRDSLTISWQALLATPALLRDSLLANAAWQGTAIDDLHDEEPGKLIHQARWGPLSALGIDPFARYYGDWATPPDFVAMLGQYLFWTNDRNTFRRLLPAARGVLDWIERYGDPDRDGFLEYRTRSPKGVKHQGWKDSDDAIVNAGGDVVDPPVATCEIQAYWYGGLQQLGTALLIAGDRALGWRLLRQARALRQRFESAYWMEQEQFYALGLGPGGRQIDAISSNPGHLLVAGIVSREHAQLVARRLLAPDLFSGWGVRTLSSENPFYNPFSYHRGSVWPVEQGTIALGFARYGLWDELHRLAEGVFALTGLFAENRLPEVVGGLPRDDRHPHPGIYPYSCEPQGWSASAVVQLVQALLSLHPVAPLRALFVDPHLPPWLPELRLEGLHVGKATVDLAFWRRGDGVTDFRVQRQEGPLRVIRQPPPNSDAGLLRRLRLLAS